VFYGFSRLIKLSRRLVCLRALIYVLVVCVVALGAEAKHSQYHSQPGAIHYLNKAVKMEGSQALKTEPPVEVATLERVPVEIRAVFHRIPWTLGEPRLCPRARQLDVRPPPSNSSL
jgi:hypothetical protein